MCYPGKMMTKGVYVPSLRHLAKTMIDNVNLHNLNNRKMCGFLTCEMLSYNTGTVHHCLLDIF